jgi:REP element-mobilizing transposase RayT
VFSETVEMTLKDICLEISKRYEIVFLEIGADKDHVHFLVQSVPKHSPTKIITIIKSITAKKIFEKHPEIKKQLWGGEFWSDGYFVSTVSKHGNEETIANYVKNQGDENKYKQLHKSTQKLDGQISLFDMG